MSGLRMAFFLQAVRTKPACYSKKLLSYMQFAAPAPLFDVPGRSGYGYEYGNGNRYGYGNIYIHILTRYGYGYGY